MAHISDLSSATQIKSGDVLPMDRGSSTLKIDYNVLAKCIIEQYSGSSLGGTAQSVKNALDTIQTDHFDLKRGTLISNGTDLNSLTTVGTYYCPTASSAKSYSNCPITERGFKMVVMETGNDNNYIRQEIRAGSITYVRNKNGASASWNDWAQVLRTSDALALRGTLPTNTNLNNVVTCGIYLLSGGNTYTNAPNTYGVLEVLQSENGYTSIMMQRLTITDAVYTRYRSSGNWYHWMKYTGTNTGA